MEPMSDQVLDLAVQIVSAHIANNTVPAEDLPALIQSVYTTLAKAGTPIVASEKPQPAVPVKRSVFADHIVCLEDGKRLKMLMWTAPGVNGVCVGWLRIPTQGGQVIRSDRGHHSDLIAATLPI
jgi:hypothetical protein